MTENFTPPRHPGSGLVAILVSAIIGALLLVAACAGVSLAVSGPKSEADASPPASARPATAWEREQAAATAVPSVPPAPELALQDITLSVEILEKKCFGSAGCHVEYRVGVELAGLAPSPELTYEVVYEVTGVEDGPAVNRLTITGDVASVRETEFAMTSSNDSVLTARPIRISVR